LLDLGDSVTQGGGEAEVGGVADAFVDFGEVAGGVPHSDQDLHSWVFCDNSFQEIAGVGGGGGGERGDDGDVGFDCADRFDALAGEGFGGDGGDLIALLQEQVGEHHSRNFINRVVGGKAGEADVEISGDGVGVFFRRVSQGFYVFLDDFDHGIAAFFF